jgi:2'-5' RNA ligase
MNKQSSLKKMAVVAIPTMRNADWNFLQSLRKKHDAKGHAFIEPHFTLLSITKQFSKQELGEILRTILMEIKKFHFFIRTAVLMPPLYEHKSWYAFLVPDQGFREFTNLHDKICTAQLHNKQDKNLSFTPHITVGAFQHKVDCLQLVDEINATKLELPGHIKKIVLIEEVNSSAYIFDRILLNE